MRSIMENGMMTISSINLKSILLVLLVVWGAFFSDPSFSASRVDRPETLYGLIDGLLVATPPLDKASVVRLTGAKLVSVEDNDAFIFYEAQNIKLKDATIDLIDYREPVAGGTATKGPFLGLYFKNSCFKREEMSSHYGSLKLKHLTPDWPTSYSRSEPWGESLFIFLADEPFCLKEIVINVKTMTKK